MAVEVKSERYRAGVLALMIVGVSAVLIVLAYAGVQAGRDSRRQSVECVRAGGQWTQLTDRCDRRG